MSLVTDLGITSATKAFQILTQTFDHGNLSLESSDEGKNDDVWTTTLSLAFTWTPGSEGGEKEKGVLVVSRFLCSQTRATL